MISFLHRLLFTTILLTQSVDAIEVIKTNSSHNIDGIANELIWQTAKWHPIDQHILGDIPSPQDFSGRFKLVWGEQALYILAEIIDDVLYDAQANPLKAYWDDDCLEIFIDEDHSGGNHQFNFNAFAYHLALDNQVVDIGPNYPDGSTRFVLLNDHAINRWKRSADSPYKITWEVALAIYDETFKLDKERSDMSNPGSSLQNLKAGKKMGFMLAYCDNDGSKNREHFYGSTKIIPVNGDKNRGYIDANVFDQIILIGD